MIPVREYRGSHHKNDRPEQPPTGIRKLIAPRLGSVMLSPPSLFFQSAASECLGLLIRKTVGRRWSCKLDTRYVP
jgi:hypothetical protein